MRKSALLSLLMVALPGWSQDVKTTILKHFKTSREFSLKVAEAMPASNYDFELSSPQMSFADMRLSG